MTAKALAALGRKTDKLLDNRQRARFNELNAVEKLLFTRLFNELKAEIDETDGRITSRKGFVSLAKAIDAVFDKVEASGLDKLGKNLVGDMGAALTSSGDYYKALKVASTGSFRGIQDAVEATMRKRLGIDKDNGIVRKGYLDQLFRTDPARDEVKKMVEKAVSAGIPMRQLEKQLRVKVQGTPGADGAAGVLEKHIGGFVLDAYQVADSITNNEFAKRLDLKYFVYSGGLIETSREFCRDKNGKVFSTEEANRDWPKDGKLLKTKAEKKSGVVTDYIPLEDRGRWRCRHRLLYISEQMAFARRPDLRPAK